MTSLSELLIAHLAKKGEKRERTGAAAFSGSSVGECPRKLAYLLHFPEKAEPLTAQVMARFGLGLAVEEEVLGYMREAGIRIVDTQREVQVPISITEEQIERLDPRLQAQVRPGPLPALMLPGHMDAVVEEEGREIPYEIKSMGSWPWKIAAGILRPKKGEQILGLTYIAQDLAYQRALNVSYGRFILRCVEKDKDAEEHPRYPLCDVKLEWDELYWREIEQSVLSAACSAPTSLPDRPYGPVPEILRGKATGRRVLPFPCSYCAFHAECFPDAELDPKAERAHTYVFPEDDPEPVPVSLDPAF